MASRGLKATLFHIFGVPIAWAILLYVAVRTHYNFSRAERIWMAVAFSAAILFRIVAAVDFCWGLENCLLQMPRCYRYLALAANRFICGNFIVYTFNGSMMLVAQRICISMELFEDRQYWCFLTFLLMGCYEVVAFVDLAFISINDKGELQAEPKQLDKQEETFVRWCAEKFLKHVGNQGAATTN